jgi:hypothetical protein
MKKLFIFTTHGDYYGVLILGIIDVSLESAIAFANSYILQNYCKDWRVDNDNLDCAIDVYDKEFIGLHFKQFFVGD